MTHMVFTGQKQPFSLETEIVHADDEWHQVAKDIDGLIASAIEKAAMSANIQLSGPAEICVVLSNDAEQLELNRKWRGIGKTTNVLSFPQIEPFSKPSGLLGDIVLARQSIVRQALEQDKSNSDHLTHLVIHGFLHILGFDHQNDKDAEQMEGLEIDILAQMGIDNPYVE